MTRARARRFLIVLFEQMLSSKNLSRAWAQVKANKGSAGVDGMKIEDFGPKFYAEDLKNYGSNIKVISNKEITLKCGTKAYRTDITWSWKNSVRMTDFVVSAYKDGKCIYLFAEAWKYHDKLEPIVQSLTFK